MVKEALSKIAFGKLIFLPFLFFLIFDKLSIFEIGIQNSARLSLDIYIYISQGLYSNHSAVRSFMMLFKSAMFFTNLVFSFLYCYVLFRFFFIFPCKNLLKIREFDFFFSEADS